MNNVVTYSPAYTLVPTYECFNHCSYCNFRTPLGQSPLLSLEEATRRLDCLKDQEITEILILSGEVHPLSPRREAWFKRIYDLTVLALSKGFFPHTNVGPLSFAEMQKLKNINFSMGLMVEQISPQLLKTVHAHAPSKVPAVRLQQLIWAGELQIPFTTGILLGIGEKPEDWWQSLEAIAVIHQQWGHIQEVILQPYSPGKKETLAQAAFNSRQLPNLIRKARQILPATITLQIPPNLIADFDCLVECLEAGAKDLGGIGPIDEVNPTYPHDHLEVLKTSLGEAGWHLVPRLPIYPAYYHYLTPSLRTRVESQIEHGQNSQINKDIS